MIREELCREDKMKMSVDIIIPIYNAFEDLEICLKSLYKHTDLTKHRLVLINDKSPDERIKPFLDAQQNNNVIVIHNETNKGFSNNINIGMSQSEGNDVILLNSDTIVTHNWVEKMVACAYSDSSIGTVTPLSNNATLCSVPNFCEENTLPEGMSVDQMAAIVEGCSMRKYPRITVAHGFCMLVKREVIQTIGYFDAETFGRGYGEENDFCNRAEQMGYVHVMCDDTYIYHSGTKSFVSKEKEAYIKEHERILRERYPEQMCKNDIYCRDNPNGWVGNNVSYHMDIWNGKKNILYLLQSDFKEGADDNVGGTQLHVKHLALGLREQMNIFVAARDRDFLQVTAYVGIKEHIFRFYIGKKELFPVFQSRELSKLFYQILVGFRIDLVHVHHTATTSLDIYYEADKLGIPVVYTAHDFYYVCPSVKMLDDEGRLCIGRQQPDCKKCLRNKLGIYEKNEYLTMWRKRHGEVLKLCKAIITPSESAKEILSSYYANISEKIQVIGHGMDAPKILSAEEKKVMLTKDLVWKIEKIDKDGRCPFVAGVAYLKDEPDVQHKVVLQITDKNGKIIHLPTNFGRNPDVLQSENRFYAYIPNDIIADGDIKIRPLLIKNSDYYQNREKDEIIKNVSFQRKSGLKVAFIGGISEEKGGKIIAEVIKQGPAEVEWYIMGGIGEESLYRLKRDNLVKTGYYYQEDLATYLLYHKIDVICILSKWPETFSYTLSEAVISHIPVIVTDIGALGQRVKTSGYGAVVSSKTEETVEAVINLINEWKVKGEAYQKIANVVKRYEHLTISQMLDVYYEVYSRTVTSEVKKGLCNNCENLERLYEAWTDNVDGHEENKLLVSKIRELEKRVDFMDNNVTVQYMLRLSRKQFPFKQKIRKFLLKRLKV